MESEEKPQGKSARRAMIEATIAKIKADNERERAARNARRWKAERDPVEYAAQKDRQRRQYQDRKDGPVRPYAKIIASTKDEHHDQAQARDAERKAKGRAAMSPAERQADTDRKADRQWVDRRREKGISEEVIQAGLIARIQERDARRAVEAQAEADDAAMKEGPTYGMF